ncbi:MAG: 2'-5' RNA ligase family protein [Bacteroidota bacterium]
MKPAGEKYFLALVPPAPVYDAVMALKEEFREAYGSKAALRSPPHLTLHMPFTWPDKKLPQLVDALARFAVGRAPVEVVLDGFGAFPPSVIFVAVRENLALRELQRALSTFARQQLGLLAPDYKDRGFHPHITIAFRDLKRAAFETAWPTFQERPFTGTFHANRLVLLRHTGKVWEVFREFGFSR